ncbi:MAG: DUF3311 domain-containing protein [Longimicrobiales bacterium]
MNLRAARTLFLAFFVVFALVLIWPGVIPFNRIEPLVLGLPFVFFWVALWVALSFVVFLLVDRVETRAARAED